MGKNKILIFGGEFNNSGAMAMTLVTVQELQQRFPNAQVVMMTGTTQSSAAQNVRFSVQSDDTLLRKYIVEGNKLFFTKEFVSRQVKDILKAVLGKVSEQHPRFLRFFSYQKIFQDAVAVIDISGFQLGSSWGRDAYERYSYLMKMCVQYQVPLYLMPQSFGPFAFSSARLSELKSLLPSVRLIFAREQEGYDQLTQLFGLDNVQLSTDLVLQSKQGSCAALLNEQEAVDFQCQKNGNNVAVLPNIRVFERCDQQQLLAVYRELIDALLASHKTVYLMRHSKEDILPAKLIKEMYLSEKQVVLVENLFLPYQFEDVVVQFDYVIASRYHSIVHAYKHHVPCIAIGWAVKYADLLEKFDQTQYMFDARSSIDPLAIQEAIAKMNVNYCIERNTIAKTLQQVQENNCFDMLENDLKEILKDCL